MYLPNRWKSILLSGIAILPAAGLASDQLGREISVPHHLKEGEEFHIEIEQLVEHGQQLFDAVWTHQEGGGRPRSKGTGAPLADPTSPLVFPRNFNRISAPDANSCAGCHNMPRSGGGGDIVANVFVLGQRFDFATFDPNDTMPTRGAVDENGNPVTMDMIANSRNTLGMFGSGYIEMLARQITLDLQAIRDQLRPGQTAKLQSKGISFGTLARDKQGNWDTSMVEGLTVPSTASEGPEQPPNLIIRPFHQAGAVISLRQFTNNAYNHHHGIQAVERFGEGMDPDDDGHVNEMSVADVTAATVFQAQLAVPGRVIPNNPEIERAVMLGEQLFDDIGCADCHISALPLDNQGWIYSEPNPFNPPGNLQLGDRPELKVDLNSHKLDLPRLKVGSDGVVWVPAYTDLKLHDITYGYDDPNREMLDMHESAGSMKFNGGNGKFMTRKLWGVANEPPYFHHGQYVTMREAVEAHYGEAKYTYDQWRELTDYERDSIIEFLKTLQILPKGTRHLIVDEHGRKKNWSVERDRNKEARRERRRQQQEWLTRMKGWLKENGHGFNDQQDKKSQSGHQPHRPNHR